MLQERILFIIALFDEYLLFSIYHKFFSCYSCSYESIYVNISGAAALKARFESQGTSSFKRRTSSSSGRDRNMSTDDEDGGGHKKMSTLSLKARFEAKAADNAPVKRNFIVSELVLRV